MRLLSTSLSFLGGVSFGCVSAMVPIPALPVELPVPCAAGACGNVAGFVTSGAASAATSGSTLTVNQTTDSAVLNWKNFNISKDGTVTFVQPGSDSVALNRIYQSDPAQIFGALNANGRIYLISQNGIVFGAGSQVNVAGLVASTLDITPEAIAHGIAGAANYSAPAFTQFTDANGNALASGAVQIQQGAVISTAGSSSAGTVYIFAPNITNEGTITTPGGQTLLAAGTPVYLTTSSSDQLRGLLVEVGTGGTVTNGNAANASVTDPAQLVGQIVAERGNVTLAGLAVNQLGRVTATTSVKEGGSIRLQARDGGLANGTGTSASLSATHGGDLTLGQNSRTEVALDTSGATAVDSASQPQSSVVLAGQRIVLDSGAQIVAHHGNVAAIASDSGTEDSTTLAGGSSSAARIYVADDALIDTSGVDITKSMDSNTLSVELRSTELADSPAQQGGVLQGKTVVIDTRLYGTRSDGTSWVGTPVADVSGWIGTIARDVNERSLTGGSVSLVSQGDVLVSSKAKVDISGGSITYTGGYINTTQLVGADGVIYDIGSADRDRDYTGVISVSGYSVQDTRWGTTRTYLNYAAQGHYEAGYVEGKDAGSLTLAGSRVVFEGTVAADVTVGAYQRKAATVLADGALYRPYDQVPLSGRLVIGNTTSAVKGGAYNNTDYLTDNVEITGGAGTSVLGGDFDPWTDTLAAGVGDTVLLRSSLFGTDGIGRLTVRTNGTFSVDAGASVQLPVFGQMDVLAGAVDVEGSIIAHAGALKLVSSPTALTDPLAGGVTLGAAGLLDVSGLWVNDLASANGGSAGHAPLATKGGSVTLSASQNDLTLAAGSLIDASGGAQLTASGAIKAGAGGGISLAVSQESLNGTATTMTLDGTLRAYALANGGSLSLTANAVCVGTLLSDCSESGSPGLLLLDPQFFQQGGFGSYALASNRGGIEVTDGTSVLLQQRNLVLDASAGNVATGADLFDMSTVALLDDSIRSATNLSLSVAPQLASGEFYNADSFAGAASLRIGTGASILGDVGASFSLQSTSRVLVDGTLSAPAGSITLTLGSGLNINGDASGGYFADQGIWLGDQAQLLARGATQLLTSDQGVISGNVLAGGTVTLDAERGHVLTSAGSVIDVSGTAAQVDIATARPGVYQRQNIGSAAGTVNLTAAEAIVLGGTLLGKAGATDVAGGTLNVTLDPTSRQDPGQYLETPANLFPAMARTVELVQAAGGEEFSSATLDPQYQGRATVGANQLGSGGFDALAMTAVTFSTNQSGTVTTHPGTVLLSGDVSLALARSLTIDAQILAGDGGSVSLSAPYVSLGNTNTYFQGAPAGTSGTGSLSLRGQLLDVRGASALQGFGDAELVSSGDLRLIGVESNSAPGSVTGSLGTAGDLTLSANQIYPTTLTQFLVSAGSGNDGTLTIARPAAATTAQVYSAAGALTLQAPHVVQSGTLRAPFGSITIDSDDIKLTDQSVTSTSGAGLSVLFGTTQGGFDWIYTYASGWTLVFNPDNQTLPSQKISLNGASVDIATGATLDLRGGGDLLAYEFVSGTKGTRDLLSGSISPTSFAVIPASSLAATPYDPQISADSDVGVGRSVYLSGYGSLPAGQYIILPARYALLPGAYLVTPVSGYTDIAAGTSYRLLNGSTVISGYYATTGTSLRDARTSGFAVLSSDQVNARAKYTLTDADQFFTAQAEANGIEAARLPRDAGTLSLAATSNLVLDGTIEASAGTGGRGAAVDISSSNITVTADGSGAAGGGLVLSAAQLDALGVESLLIGGSRTDTDSGIAIDTAAGTVEVQGGVTLSAPELLLVASQSVNVDAGATLSGTGTATTSSRNIALSGDGAFLRVASGALVDVARTGGGSGQLNVAQGAALDTSGGAIQLETADAASVAGSILANGGGLSLTGNLITIGGSSSTGFVLDPAQLAQSGISTLLLHSRGSIDLAGNVDFTAENLTLQAQQLRGIDSNATLNATGTLTLAGVDDANGAVVSSGSSGSLTLNAGNIVFGGSQLTLSGFANAALNATATIDASADTTLQTAGNLALSAQRFSTGSGVDLSLVSGGALSYAAAGGGTSLAAVSSLGGELGLTGATVDIDGAITLPSGIVNLVSTAVSGGGVHLGSAALIDLSGRRTTLGSTTADSAGGSFNVTTLSGDYVADAGSGVDVSGSNAASGGAVTLSAASGTITLDGTLAGGSTTAFAGGSFTADAAVLPGVDALAGLLGTGGFSGQISLRQRGPGDLALSAGQQISARRITLEADQGNLSIDGTLQARAGDGGRITLLASGDLTIGGTLDARAGDGTQRNGRLDIESSNGGLSTGSGAVIETLGDNAAGGSAGDGGISIRLPQASLLTLSDADAGNDKVTLAGDWSKAGQVTVEGFKVYTAANGTITAGDTVADASNPYYADAAAFAASASALQSQLQSASGASALNVVAGIEIRSNGDLELDSDWDLSQWRFNGQPGVLTLRAAGNLTFNASLSDGFSGTTGTNAFNLTATDNSWSYRLTAGADLGSANTQGVQTLATLPAGSGSLLVAAGDTSSTSGYRMIRTGTGSIDIAAAADVVLGNAASMIYTAGVAQTGVSYSGRSNSLNGLLYPQNGGDITLSAGRDVVGAVSDQLVTDWLWRVGNTDSLTSTALRSTAWTVNFARFQQGVATLGGGDVTVTAGRNVTDLSVSAPTIGRQTGSTLPANNVVDVTGGGRIAISAAGDVLGGTYYSGRGSLDIAAGGSIGASATTGIGAVVALGDAAAVLHARRSVDLAAVLNPTLLPQGTSQSSATQNVSYFSTYGDNSRLDIESDGGGITLQDGSKLVGAWADVRTGTDNDAAAFSIAPPILTATALRGDVSVLGALTLFPRSDGYVSLRAYDDLSLAAGAVINVSDTDPSSLPGIQNPSQSLTVLASEFDAVAQSTGFNASAPVRGSSAAAGALHASELIAQQGDVVQQGSGTVGTVDYFGGPLTVYAGEDVVDLGVLVQNLVAADVSSITAGRDITYSLGRTSTGHIAQNFQSITVDGPGYLTLTAGRNLNLEDSGGISTRGNTVNAALADGGASISALVGLEGRSPDYAGFEKVYVHDSQIYAGELQAYIGSLTGSAPADYAAALTAFEALSLEKQIPFLQQVLFAELRAAGRYAASSDPVKHDDYSAGYQALETMFPGSNPQASSAATDTYAGNIDLYFSRIYTLDGGDISLLAPGGYVNAGLSSAPGSFGVSKDASQLGIVAQTTGNLNILVNGDLAVNESRVFAADGGSILVWSTDGDIDAGRGAKTAISAAAPTITVDLDGVIHVTYPATLTGSGIQAIGTSPGVGAGDVDLYAPHGVVNAGDAGIVAGNLTIGATAVLGADNIKFSGVAVGVPVDTGGLGASLQGVSNAASGAAAAATAAMDAGGSARAQQAPLAEAALSWLDVFVLGLGEENCKQDDLDCLKRQARQP